MTPLSRFRLGAIITATIIVCAVAGYYLLGERSLLESIFMVIITVSGVGFSETSTMPPHMQVFTVAVIITGMTAVAYTIGGIIQMVAEGEIERVVSQRRMTQGVDRMKDHVILCGFGRNGQILAANLHQQGVPFVVVERDGADAEEAMSLNYMIVVGDATEEQVLLNAGVDRAKTVVSVLPSDAGNVFITLTSRNLNPRLQIIARAEFETSRNKLLQAGADRIVMPAVIGADSIARLITRPTTAEVIELVGGSSSLDVQMEEMAIPHEHTLVGTTVRETSANRRHGLLFVAVKHVGGDFNFNPEAEYEFLPNDTLIVMGRSTDIDQFRNEQKL